MKHQLSGIWWAPGLRPPRASIAFKPDVVIIYDEARDLVTEMFVDQKRRRVRRKQAHLKDVAVQAMAAFALGQKPSFEIDCG